MFWKDIDVIIEDGELSRRVLRFSIIDCNVVLNEDRDEKRETKRHKFKANRRWMRLHKRESNMNRREIPYSAILQAVEEFRKQIRFDEFRV